MGWKRELEFELEVAVADALGGGPASPTAVSAAERNMRVILDRWLAQGRMVGMKGYQLEVHGGSGLTVDLRFVEQQVVKEVGLKVDPR